MMPEWAVLMEAYMADTSEERDIRPLSNAVLRNLRTAKVSELGPCFAVLYHHAFDFDMSTRWRSYASRAFVASWLWALRTFCYRGRPLWNDFHMALWQLSRDAYYVHRLHEHLKLANAMQRVSGEWMVNSVCEQDPEFAGHWRHAVELMGPVFAGSPLVGGVA